MSNKSSVTKPDELDSSSEKRDNQAPFSDKGSLEKLLEQTTSNVKGTSSEDNVFSIVGQEKNFSKSSSDSKDNQEDEAPPRGSLKRRGALVPMVIEEPSIDSDDSSTDPASDSCCCLHF
ncbi:uncharacterized protein [Parasteatoda tepidariorum]|uniref:uncharacterized protein n=1 Tax=Parasteatoda tepidariorum TaxID=114398 RepID=UPI0039BCFB0E